MGVITHQMLKSLLLILTFSLFKTGFPADFELYNLNVDTWEMRIGRKQILNWQKNKIGDTVLIDKNKIGLTDTLFVQRYLCGQSGQNSTTTLTIKNEKNEIVQQSINTDNQFVFTGKISLATILSSDKLAGSKVLEVIFSIDSRPHKINETVVLGRLKFK